MKKKILFVLLVAVVGVSLFFLSRQEKSYPAQMDKQAFADFSSNQKEMSLYVSNAISRGISGDRVVLGEACVPDSSILKTDKESIEMVNAAKSKQTVVFLGKKYGIEPNAAALIKVVTDGGEASSTKQLQMFGYSCEEKKGVVGYIIKLPKL